MKQDIVERDGLCRQKTARLLRTIGFQIPIELQQSGYIGSISHFGQNVNINGEPFSKVFKESATESFSAANQTTKTESKVQFSAEEYDNPLLALAGERKTAQKNTDQNGGERYSITEPFVDNNGTQFDSAVLLDTEFFNGLSPRKWGSKLRSLVKMRADTDPFILPIADENGNMQQLQFADPSDRVSKNGGPDHNVLNELASGDDNISKLAVVHIDEIVDVSEEGNPYYSADNVHGWLDDKGWLHRTANVINAKNGNVYELTLDIAKTKDGRHILFATKGKIKRVGNAKVNSLNIRGSKLNSNSNNKISQPDSTVKRKENEYQFAVEHGDMDAAQRLVEQAAVDAGYTIRACHEPPILFGHSRRAISAPEGI